LFEAGDATEIQKSQKRQRPVTAACAQLSRKPAAVGQ
jgi:hypothetical protein